jgi:hypothetical protein
MAKYRPVKPVPIPLGYAGLDISMPQVMYLTGESYSQVLRRCKAGDYESYKLGEGTRRVVLDSVMRFRQRCIEAGPQFSERPVSAKRKPGRPRTNGDRSGRDGRVSR